MQYDTFFAGAYRIEQQLQHSEYSVLALGKKRETGLPVMLRLWLTADATTAETQQRIQAEVAALQYVQHPHLLPLLEVGASAQGVFLVSMWAASGSLHDRLQHHGLTPLPYEEGLELIQQIGQGLQALHQHGLVHGNLTPHTVFFSEPEHARLGDFWQPSILASIEHYQPALEEGVPRCWYMAPEQFHGVLSAQSDQYALGCLAYLLLAGQVPFAGSARATLVQKHQRDQPTSLVEHNPALPRHVEAAVFKALAKHPGDRHPSIQAFLQALEEPQRTEIAAQDTLPHTFGVAFAIQEEEAQPPFDGTLERSVWAALDEEAFPLEDGPVTAATWSRTRASGATSAAQVHPEAKRRPVRNSPNTRGRVVLFSLACLVLVIVVATARWLFVSSGGPQQNSRQTASTNVRVTVTATSAHHPTLAASPTPTATPSPISAVAPLLDCVTSTGGNLVAHFGYRNPNAFAVTLPLGKGNVISPSSLNGSQPTIFAPGSQHEVFQLTFFKHQTVVWSLEGTTATASSSSPRC